jgi:FKBP-type peptidyl-prolyl cis-trans isomerase SlyD
MSKESIADGKYVELTYKVIDQNSGGVLTQVEYPLGYVHGTNEILAPSVMAELEGKTAGDVIEVPIDCNQLYGPRDESLVLTERIQNVPEEYREVGMSADQNIPGDSCRCKIGNHRRQQSTVRA